MSAGRGPALGVAAVLLAAAAASPMVVDFEGWKLKSYADITGVPTACGGATSGVKLGGLYTDRECMDLLARDLVAHGMRIDGCLPPTLPTPSRAAFTSAAYNIGSAAFCGSSMSRRALAGDLAGACAALDLWVKAGGKVVTGLVRRRAAERAYCERGLAS